jgi:L-amino acid N-acyltransferase YncA
MGRESQLARDDRTSSGGLMLADGAVVEIRSLERADRRGLAAGAARLSERTRYLRFASSKSHLTDRELDWLTDLDHHSREALLAVDPATREGIAVARYAELSDEPGVVDLAVTVNDAWQKRGLGGQLLSRVIDRAREEGHRAMRATILAENAASLALVRRAGFLLRSRDGVLVEFELPLV